MELRHNPGLVLNMRDEALGEGGQSVSRLGEHHHSLLARIPSLPPFLPHDPLQDSLMIAENPQL